MGETARTDAPWGLAEGARAGRDLVAVAPDSCRSPLEMRPHRSEPETSVAEHDGPAAAPRQSPG